MNLKKQHWINVNLKFVLIIKGNQQLSLFVNTKAQFESYKQESSETIENAANRLKVSRVGFSKSEMGGTDDLSKKE